MHTHPDRVTKTYSRAAGSAIKCIHVPTLSHTHIYSESTASRKAGSRVQLKLTHKPSTYRPTTTITLKNASEGNCRWGLARVGTQSRAHACAHTHIHKVWSEARATGTTKGKQTRGEFLNHIRMCRREGGRERGKEGGRESRPGEGVIFHTGPAMSALPVRVLEAGVQACAALSTTHL